MGRRDHLEIIEASYSLAEPEAAWHQRLTDLVAARLGRPAFSFTYDASDLQAFKRENLIGSGADATQLEHARALLDVRIEPEHIPALFCTSPHLVSARDAVGPDVFDDPAHRETIEAVPEVQHFTLAVRTLDPSRIGLCFVIENRRVSDRERRYWGLIASHIAIAYRLRRSLVGAEPGDGDAVLDHDGACHHAEGDARDGDARDQLRHAARQVMRARGALRHSDTAEALAIWRGLVDGRWSLVDRFDTDGKHFLVAHRNPPDVRDRRAFSERERQVAGYLGMGFPNKLIGYSLGITGSAVADHVASISRKLKSKRRVDLVRILSALEPPD